MAKRKTGAAPLTRFLFLVYCGVMLWLLFGRENHWTEVVPYRELLTQNANFTPLLTIRNYVYVVLHSQDTALVRHCIINLVGNVILFIPAGWLFPRIFPRLRRFFPFLFTCLGIMLTVELLQLVTLLGSFDIDDIILNLGSMILGYLLSVLTMPKS